MKRATFRIVFFLLLGTIINVAVAWAYAVAFDIYPRDLKWIESLGLSYSNKRDAGLIEWECGFPLRSLACHWHMSGYTVANRCWSWEVPSPLPESLRFKGDESTLPLRPVWTGFAINTVLYALLGGLLFNGPFQLRRLIRYNRGLCTKCGYDLRGNSGAVCPECGATP